MSSVECNTCSRLREVRESQACLLPGWVSDGEASSLFSTLTHLPVLLALTLGWVGLFLLSVASFISAMHSWNTSKVTPTIVSNYVMNEQQHAVVVVCSVLPASALVYITIQIQANMQQDQIRTWIAVLHVDFKLLEIPAGVHRQSPDTIMLVNRGQNNGQRQIMSLPGNLNCVSLLHKHIRWDISALWGFFFFFSYFSISTILTPNSLFAVLFVVFLLN